MGTAAKDKTSHDDCDSDIDFEDEKRRGATKKATAALEEEPKEAASALKKKMEGRDDEGWSVCPPSTRDDQGLSDSAEAEEEDAEQDDVKQEEAGGGAQVLGWAQEGESSYSKIYVDEVQDLTQAEIALLFMLSKSRRFQGRTSPS